MKITTICLVLLFLSSPALGNANPKKDALKACMQDMEIIVHDSQLDGREFEIIKIEHVTAFDPFEKLKKRACKANADAILQPQIVGSVTNTGGIAGAIASNKDKATGVFIKWVDAG